VNVSVLHPEGAGGIQGWHDSVNARGWERVYWKGQTPGEVKIEIDESRLRIDGRAYGKVASGGTVRINVMNGVEVVVDGQLRPAEPPNDDQPVAINSDK
jgi:hypothetical protein